MGLERLILACEAEGIELGEENPVSDADEMKEQLKKIKASVEVKERIRKEINRFQNMPAGSRMRM